MRFLFPLLLSLFSLLFSSGSLSAETGVAERSILLGSHLPLSGAASEFSETAKGAQAFFQYINDQGGVLGRRLELRVEDDRFLPQGAVRATETLITEAAPLLFFAPSADQTHLAVRPFLQQLKRPSFWVPSHREQWTKPVQPDVFAFLPSPQVEARVVGQYLQQQTRTTLTVWYQDDPDYREAAGWLRSLLETTLPLRFVQAAAPGSTVLSEVEAIRDQRPGGVILLAEYGLTHAFLEAAQRVGLRSDLYVGSALAEMQTAQRYPRILPQLRILSALPLPVETDHPGLQLHRQLLQVYQPGQAVTRWTIQGQASAELMVAVLQKNGRALSAQSVLETAETLDQPAQSLLPPIRLSPSQHRALTFLRLIRLTPDAVEPLSSWIDGR